MRALLEWRRLFDTKLVELTEYGFAAITRLKVDDIKDRHDSGNRGPRPRFT